MNVYDRSVKDVRDERVVRNEKPHRVVHRPALSARREADRRAAQQHFCGPHVRCALRNSRIAHEFRGRRTARSTWGGGQPAYRVPPTVCSSDGERLQEQTLLRRRTVHLQNSSRCARGSQSSCIQCDMAPTNSSAANLLSLSFLFLMYERSYKTEYAIFCKLPQLMLSILYS